MANYYGVARSNYFKVRDAAGFKSWVAEFGGVEVKEEGEHVMLLSGDYDSGGWSIVENTDDDMEIIDVVDFATRMSAHLQPGQVAVFMEIGHEKLRYLVGYAVAVDSHGRTVVVGLDDIYKKAAEEFGVPLSDITSAEY